MRMYVLFTALGLLLLVTSDIYGADNDNGQIAKEDIFEPNQISASLFVRYAKQLAKMANSEEDKLKEEKRLVIVYDLYIKARSYAFMNKIFFFFSVISAVGILLWPSVGVIFKRRLNNIEWFKSSIIQTTITGIAAMTFTFYSEYKDKQTYTENLMRYAIFSNEEIDILSRKVTEEISKIDRGFSFSSLINKENEH